MSEKILAVSVAATQREQLMFSLMRGYPAPMAELPDKLGAIAAAVGVFTEHRVPYALIGGLAVGIHSGVPRATLDVDFAILTTVDRELLRAHLGKHGFVHTGVFPHSINFRHNSGEPVQLAFDPLFDPMLGRADVISLQDLQLRIVTKADLISMKRRAAADPARPRSKALRDQADVALLEGDVPGPNEGW